MLLIAILYLTGYHKPVMAGIQSLILKTGLFTASPEPDENFGTTRYSLQLNNAEGERVWLEQFKGKPIFLNFWASWCAPCIAEMPEIAEAAKATEGNVAFILVTVEEDASAAQKLLDRKNIDLPLYTLAGSRPEELKSNAVPTTFVVDRQGTIVYKREGMASYGTQEFINWLKAL